MGGGGRGGALGLVLNHRERLHTRRERFGIIHDDGVFVCMDLCIDSALVFAPRYRLRKTVRAVVVVDGDVGG